MTSATAQPTESQARRSSALESALGPLRDLLADEHVVEVMLNADGVVWVERIGEGLVRTTVRMASTESERMLRLVAAEMLVELNAQHPSLSAKLPAPWGARLQANIPPIVDAPVFALRKPARIVFSLDDYVKRGIVSVRQRDALVAAVHDYDNILIGGGTGSGKTTFANALLKVIAQDTTERLVLVGRDPHDRKARNRGRLASARIRSLLGVQVQARRPAADQAPDHRAHRPYDEGQSPVESETYRAGAREAGLLHRQEHRRPVHAGALWPTSPPFADVDDVHRQSCWRDARRRFFNVPTVTRMASRFPVALGVDAAESAR